MTFDGDASAPIWTPTGDRLIFGRPTGHFWTSPLFSVVVDATSGIEPLTTEGHHNPHAVTPDGRELIFTAVDHNGLGDILALKLGPRALTQAVVQTEQDEGRGGVALSLDGRWLAYTSDATGREEVWVRSYPTTGAARRISANGGREPVWSRDRRELFYLEGDTMMSVLVKAAWALGFEPPRPLFAQRYAGRRGQPPSYDVAQDGRFLMIKSSRGPGSAWPSSDLAWRYGSATGPRPTVSMKSAIARQ